MKRRSHLGFTLIELLAIMIILGVVMGIAIVSVSSYLKKGKTEYYHSLENNVLAAGRDYLLDYKSLLPREIGNTTIVTSEELIKNHYIDEIVDEDKNACSATVTVEKKDKNDYNYYVCLQCSEKYKSEESNCELVGTNNESKNFTINLNADIVQIVNQCDDHSIPAATVYQVTDSENKLVTNSLLANPKSIDTTVLGETAVTWTYRYKSISKTVRVVDKVAPTDPVVKLVYPNGTEYKPTDASGDSNITNRTLSMVVTSRDYACPTKYPTLDGSGLKTLQYKNVNASDWITVNTTKNTTKTSISNSLFGKVHIKAVDKYGNESGLTEFEIYVDKDKPSKTIVTYLGGSNSHSWKNNYKLKLSATDNIGVSYYEVDWNNDGVVDQTTSDIYIPVNNFSYCNVRFRAVDFGGNRGEWSDTQDIHMDTENPSKTTVDLGDYNSGDWTNQNVTQTFSATDNVSVSYYEYSHDENATSGVKISSNPWTISWDGNWNFYVRAVDLAGNRGAWSDKYIIKRDTVLPSCTLKVTNNPGTKDDWYIDETQIGFASVSDNSNSIASQVVDRPSVTETSVNGDTITGTVIDSAGNSATCTLTLKVDAVQPTITFVTSRGSNTSTKFINKVKSTTFGPLGGSTTCSPATGANKPSSVTCTATGNNGKSTPGTFKPLYSTTPTISNATESNCRTESICNSAWGCGNVSCEVTDPETGNRIPSICCERLNGSLGTCPSTENKCDYSCSSGTLYEKKCYSCPSGSTLSSDRTTCNY